jgi:hypothetical protein
LNFIAFLLSITITYLSLWGFSSSVNLSLAQHWSDFGSLERTFMSPVVWMCKALIVVTCIMPYVIGQFIFRIISPTQEDRIRMFERARMTCDPEVFSSEKEHLWEKNHLRRDSVTNANDSIVATDSNAALNAKSDAHSSAMGHGNDVPSSDATDNNKVAELTSTSEIGAGVASGRRHRQSAVFSTLPTTLEQKP